MKAYRMRLLPLVIFLLAVPVFGLALPVLTQSVTAPGLTGVFLPNPVPAAATAVVVPYGDTLNQILQTIRDSVLTIVVAFAAYAARSLPSVVDESIKLAIANKWLDRAVDFGFNTTEGALAGKTVTAQVGSAVAVNAVSYIMAHAPKWLISWLGGHEDDIRDWVLARIPTQQGATLAATVGGTVADVVAQPPAGAPAAPANPAI